MRLFFLFVLLGNFQAWAGHQVRVLALKMQGPAGVTSCTGTLMKMADEQGRSDCQLYTNAHCFEKPVSQVSITEPFGKSSLPSGAATLFAKASGNEARSSLIKIDPRKDLAQLEVPEELSSACRSLDLFEADFRINWNNGSPRLSLLSLGFHGGKAQAVYTNNQNWDSGRKSIALIYSASTGLPGVPRIFRLTGLQMLPGMSGGPTVDDNYNLMGINRRYVPFQSYTEIIPVEDLLRFMLSKGDEESLEAVRQGKGVVLNADGNISHNAGENSGGNGGENSGGNGGENSGGNGGENSGGNGGENSGGNGSDTQGPTKDGALAFLREPAEGIMVNGRRLLALGKYQIDGGDDYRQIPKHFPPVYQDSPEFLDGREDLIERLSGYFEYNLISPHEATEKIFRKKNGNWEVYHENKAIWTDINVVPAGTEFQLKFVQDPRGLLPAPKYPINELASLHTNFQLEGKFVDASTLTLTGQTGELLTCKNDFQFKLICSGQREEISLSLNNINETLSFRHAQIRSVKIKGKMEDVIVYRYGRLYKF